MPVGVFGEVFSLEREDVDRSLSAGGFRKYSLSGNDSRSSTEGGRLRTRSYPLAARLTVRSSPGAHLLKPGYGLRLQFSRATYTRR